MSAPRLFGMLVCAAVMSVEGARIDSRSLSPSTAQPADSVVDQQVTIDPNTLQNLLDGALPFAGTISVPVPGRPALAVRLEPVSGCEPIEGHRALRGRVITDDGDEYYVKVVAGAGSADIMVLGDKGGWIYSVLNAPAGLLAARQLNPAPAVCLVNADDQARLVAFAVNAAVPAVRRWPAAPRIFQFAVSTTADFQKTFPDVARVASVNVHFASTMFEKAENVALCPIMPPQAVESPANPLYPDMTDSAKARHAHEIFKSLGLKFDLGQVFDMEGPSWGEPGALCKADIAGRGITNWSATVPVEKRYDNVWLLTHETAHQLGAAHTFNGNFSGRMPASAVEPGNGLSFMGYPPIRTALWFHPYSVGQMLANVHAAVLADKNCGRPYGTTATTTPTMKDTSRQVPHDTPFQLNAPGTGSARFSIGEVTAAIKPDQAPPWFNAQAPSGSAQFTFPSADDKGPSSPVKLLFLSLGRDLAGSIAFGAHEVVVTKDGPFGVGVQSGWRAGTSVALTWTPGGTQNPPLNVAWVDVSISTGPGQAWRPLQAHVANKGTATIVLGPNDYGDESRVLLTAPGQSFFAVSQPFQILPP